jgi:hypothetical protein
MIKIFSIALAVLFLSACSMTATKTKVRDPLVMHPTAPDPLELYDIEWEIWDYAKLREVYQQLDPENNDFVVITTPIENFEKYILNNEEMKRYIQQQNVMLLYYKMLFPPEPDGEDK